VAEETGVEGEDQMNFGQILVKNKVCNQLLQNGFLNLAGQGDFQPHPPLTIPPLQPYPNNYVIPIQPHVSM
jgi:hypothetical protein